MAVLSNQTSVPSMDPFSRLLIVAASFFSIAALALAIVGLTTTSWYYNQDLNGNTLHFNLFTQCSGNIKNQTITCSDISRDTDFGRSTQYAAAFLIVAICLLGCGMFVILFMNFIQLTGILLFIAPLVLFLSTLFMVATFAEGSRVTVFNSYSAILVQTSHAATIFSLYIIAFASGRLHIRFYQQL